LGAILYYILSGRAPYAGDNALDILQKVRSGPPEPLSSKEQAWTQPKMNVSMREPHAQEALPLPRALVKVCERAMAREPENRFSTASDLAGELQLWLEGAKRDLLHDFAIKMVSVINSTELAWFVARELVGSLGYDDCVIYYLDESTTRLNQVAAIGEKNPERETIINPLSIPVGTGVTGEVASTKRYKLIKDLRFHGNYVYDLEQGLSELCVPIMFGEKLYGVLDSESKIVNGFNEEDLKSFEIISRLMASKIALIEKTELINKHAANLEKQVEDRTRELKNANKRLEVLAPKKGL